MLLLLRVVQQHMKPASLILKSWAFPILFCVMSFSVYRRLSSIVLFERSASLSAIRAGMTGITRPMATHAQLPRHGDSQKAVIDSGEFDTTHGVAARKYLRSYGLIPPSVESYEIQARRCLKQLALKSTTIEKYSYLSQLRNSDVHLFYRLAVDHMKDIMPLVYTPVVGEVCQKWSEIYTQPEGMVRLPSSG